MPKLSFVEAEARRLVGKFPEAKQRALQAALIELCEAHWREIRGPEPATVLAHALWVAAPPLAELFADLHAAGDARFGELLDGLRPARALALLVLAEIERGDAEGVHIAYEAMMTFDSPAAGRVYEERVALGLRGALRGPPLHRHSSREPLRKAVAAIVAHTGRHDLKALVAVVGLLAGALRGTQAQPDESLERLREAVRELAVRFLGIDDKLVRLELHGREHKPVSRKRLGDILAEVRQARLA
jgi:hypothetical protein